MVRTIAVTLIWRPHRREGRGLGKFSGSRQLEQELESRLELAAVGHVASKYASIYV